MVSAGVTTSIRWWTTRVRSPGPTLPVPMSIPRYTCCESADTTSPPAASATRSASADFPEAVGPTISTMRMRYLFNCHSFLCSPEPPCDLGNADPEEHRPAVRTVRPVVDRVHRLEERGGLGLG